MGQPRTDASGQIQKPAAAKSEEPPKGAQATGTGTGPTPAEVEQKRETLWEMLKKEGTLKAIKRALPKHLPPERMLRIAVTAVRTNPLLSVCLPETFFGCLLQASQLGLEVNTPMGHAWLIPRRNGKLSDQASKATNGRVVDVYECTMMIGYQGMIDLSRRSGLVKNIRARAVKVGDFLEYEDGLYPKLLHGRSVHPDREQQEITHAYAVARMADDEREFEVLTRAQIEARRMRSAAGSLKTSPWWTDYEAMACKSSVRALWKWLPKSSEMATAEGMEVAADLGRSQGPAMDERVHQSIEDLGMNALPADSETGDVFSTIQWDQVTGDVAPGQEALKVEG